MAPITLKLSGRQEDLPFATLDQEELCNTWRVCTRIKDALEEGSRLENLSWRLWFLQNVLGKQQKHSQSAGATATTNKLPHFTETVPTTTTTTTTTTAVVVNTEPTTTLVSTSSSLDFGNTKSHVEPTTSTMSMPTTLATNADFSNNRVITENFKMHQFSSDQANDPVIPLEDMFGPEGIQEFLNSISDIQMTMPSTTTTTAATTTTATTPNYFNQPHYVEQQPFDNFALFDHSFQPVYNPSSMTIPTTTLEDYYIDPFSLNYSMISAAASTSIIPNATLHNKLLATLPKQTLVSAERLLAPTTVQQQKRPLPNSTALYQNQSKKQKKPDYYYSTFQAQSNQDNNENNDNSIGSQQQQQTCSNCDATSTPLWRRSADDQLLCNACGLYLKLHNTPRPKHLKSVNRNNKDEFITDIHAIAHQQQYLKQQQQQQQQQQNQSAPSHKESVLDKVEEEKEETEQVTMCTNCSTTKTPLWRRDDAGNPLCNACGLYLKLHNEKRPLSMKTDVIKKRQRTETIDESKIYQEKNSLPGTGVLVMSTHKSVV